MSDRPTLKALLDDPDYKALSPGKQQSILTNWTRETINEGRQLYGNDFKPSDVIERIRPYVAKLPTETEEPPIRGEGFMESLSRRGQEPQPRIEDMDTSQLRELQPARKLGQTVTESLQEPNFYAPADLPGLREARPNVDVGVVGEKIYTYPHGPREVLQTPIGQGVGRLVAGLKQSFRPSEEADIAAQAVRDVKKPVIEKAGILEHTLGTALHLAASTPAMRVGEKVAAKTLGALIKGKPLVSPRMAQTIGGFGGMGAQEGPEGIVRGGVQGAALSFIPHAKTILVAAGVKAPTDAMVLALAGNLYDTTIHGEPFDVERVAGETLGGIPFFAFMNALPHAKLPKSFYEKIVLPGGRSITARGEAGAALKTLEAQIAREAPPVAEKPPAPEAMSETSPERLKGKLQQIEPKTKIEAEKAIPEPAVTPAPKSLTELPAVEKPTAGKPLTDLTEADKAREAEITAKRKFQEAQQPLPMGEKPATLEDVFAIEGKGGKWFINRNATPVAIRNRGRPFASRTEAMEHANAMLPDEIKRLQSQQIEEERESEKRNRPQNSDVDAVAEMNIPHERDLMPEDVERRVVYGAKRGQSLDLNSLAALDVKGDNPNVKGVHVGDSDYWLDRLKKDYGRTGGQVINIRAAEGDRLIEDTQYITDPDTGIKADSAILLTARKELKYGKDWVFDGEEFKGEPAPAEPAKPEPRDLGDDISDKEAQRLVDESFQKEIARDKEGTPSKQEEKDVQKIRADMERERLAEVSPEEARAQAEAERIRQARAGFAEENERLKADLEQRGEGKAPPGGAGLPAGKPGKVRRSIFNAEQHKKAEAEAGEPIEQPFITSERVHAVLDKLGVPAAERYVPKRFLGIFKYRSKNIRVKSLSDVFVATHEATHWISNEFGISKRLIADTGQGNLLRKRLTDIYTEFYPGAKRTHKLKKRMEEGLATLLENYAYMPSEIVQKYPELVNTFIKPSGKYYHPKFTELLNGIGDIVGEHARLSPEEQIGARIVRGEEVVRRDTGFNFAQRFVFEAFNAAEPLVRYARQAGEKETIQDPTVWYYSWLDRGTVMAYWIKGDWITGENTVRFTPEGKTIVEPGNIQTYARKVVGKEKEFDSYLVARRVVEDHNRLAEMKEQSRQLQERLEPNEETGEMPKEQLAEIEKLTQDITRLQSTLANDNMNLAAANATTAKFDKTFTVPVKIYDAINERLVKFARDMGLISPESAAEWLSRKGYASFLRHVTDELLGGAESNPYSTSSQSKAKAFKERKGSELAIVSPVFNQMTAIAEVVSKAMQNAVWRKAFDLGNTNPEIARRLEKVETIRVPRPEGGFDYPQDKDPNLIKVWKDGQRIFVKPAPEFKAMMEFMKPTDMGIVADLLTQPSAVFTRLTTSANPIWSLGNITIDQIQATMTTRTGYKPVLEPIKGLKQFLSEFSNLKPEEQKEFKRFLVAGGKRSTLAGSLREATPEKFITGLEKPHGLVAKTLGVIDSGLNILELPSNFSEYLSRFGEYKRSISKGEPDLVALYRAAEVTTPFKLRGNLGGKTGQVWVRAIPYLNAALEVSYKFGKTVRDNPERTATITTVALATSFVTAIAIMNAASDKQKRLLRNMPAGEFGRSLFFPLPVGEKLARIRIPEQIGALTAPAYLYTIANYDKTKVRFNELLDASTQWIPDALNVSQPTKAAINLIPTTLRPSVQVAANVKTYPEIAPIVPNYILESKEAPDQYTAYTSKVAVAMGKLFNVSPAKTEFWIRNQFGAVGGMMLGKFQSLPLVRQESEVALNGRLYNWFYETRDTIAKQYKKTLQADNVFSYEEKREIQNSHKLYNDMANRLAFMRRNPAKLSEANRQKITESLLALERNETTKAQSLISALPKESSSFSLEDLDLKLPSLGDLP